MARAMMSEDPTVLPRGEYGFPGPLRDALVAAIIDGSKTTTSSLLEERLRGGEPLPTSGYRELVVDSRGVGVCITELTGIRTCRMADVFVAHAVGEGEGFATVEQWRTAHEKFWTSAEFVESLGAPPVPIDDDTEVVCEEFTVIRRV